MSQPLDYPEHLPEYGWGPAPQAPPGESAVVIVVRIIAGVFGAAAIGLWLLCTFMVLTSLYSSSISSDPHGYGAVFGTIFGVPAGIVGAALLPLAFPLRRWPRAYLVVVPVFLVLLGLQFVAMYLS